MKNLTTKSLSEVLGCKCINSPAQLVRMFNNCRTVVRGFTSSIYAIIDAEKHTIEFELVLDATEYTAPENGYKLITSEWLQRWIEGIPFRQSDVVWFFVCNHNELLEIILEQKNERTQK